MSSLEGKAVSVTRIRGKHFSLGLRSETIVVLQSRMQFRPVVSEYVLSHEQFSLTTVYSRSARHANVGVTVYVAP